MMKMNKSQNMNEMMNKMSDSERAMMMEKMMGMFCSMDGKMMPCDPQKKMECMCPSCPVASDMDMAMTNSLHGKGVILFRQ